MSINPWLVPAAVIGAIGVGLQGAKAAWDFYMSIVTRANSSRAVRLQETNSLLNFLDSLPLDETRKAMYKVKVVRELESGSKTEAMYAVIQEALKTIHDE